MKNALRISLLLIALLFLLAWRFAPARQASDEPEPSGEVRRPDAAVPDHTRTLRVLHGGAVEERTMDEYLLGVRRAEMPASFEREALKAQAVSAHTWALYCQKQARQNGQPYDFSADPSRWQGCDRTAGKGAVWQLF